MNCALPNFTKFSTLGIPGEILELPKIDDLMKGLIEYLRGLPSYSLEEETSLTPLKMKQSIDDMIQKVLDIMDSTSNSNLNLKKGGTDSETVKENLKMEFYPKGNITREEELDLTAVITGQLASRELIEAQRLNTALDTFFANNLPAKEYFKTHFARELGLLTVVKIGKTLKDSVIVDDLKTLNENIEDFLAKQYLTVFRYLSSLGFSKGLSSSMFRDHRVVGTYLNTMDRMYNILAHKSKLGTLEDDVEDGWRRSLDKSGENPIVEALTVLRKNITIYKNNYKTPVDKDVQAEALKIILERAKDIGEIEAFNKISEAITNKSIDDNILQQFNELFNKILKGIQEGPSLFEAMNAYLSITYFDKLTKEAIGKYISSNKLDYPIMVNSDGEKTYKYKFGKDTENRVHGWEVSVRDALKEMGNFSKFLISSIPIDDTYLTPVNYLSAFTNLFGKAGLLFGSSNDCTELYNIIATFNTDPVSKMRDLLTKIATSNSVRSTLLSKKISNPYEMKVFDAVYDNVFKGANSLYGIESAYNRVKGLANRYPLVESLAALIASSTEMSYLLTVYNYNENKYETVVKKKYQTKKKFFDMIRSINNDNQNMGEVDLAYKFLKKTSGEYLIDLGLHILLVQVTAEDNPYGILTKNSKTRGVLVTVINKQTNAKVSLKDLFDKADLSTKRKRLILIDTRGNSALMDVLGFIDFINGTGFTTTLDGLLEFELFKSNFEGSPFEATLSAVRGLVIRDIHDAFRRAIDRGEYNSSQILEFIKDTKIFRDSILGLDPTDKDWKSIWEPSILGPDLITVSTSQNWINDYVTVTQIMSGEISKANTKNLAGDNVPNYGLAFMGANLHLIILDKQHANDSLERLPLSTNLFMDPKNRSSIKGTVVDTDVRLADGSTALIKNMTEGELFYHSFVNKFLVPLVLNEPSNRSIYIQPTTYSDKTKFVTYLLGVMFGGKNITKMSNLELIGLYISSIGDAYRNILKRVLTDYALLFDMLDLLAAAYPGETQNDVAVREMVRQIDRRLASMTELDLIALKNAKNLDLEILADTHFRKNKNRKLKVNGESENGLAFNESLVSYALDTYTRPGLESRLKIEKRRFLNLLLKNKFIIDGIRVYNGDPDENSLYTKALKEFGESTSWIQDDGTLTLAKVNGKELTTYLQVPEDAEVELNPLLDKFFMIHSLLGNNLRMLLTGSEINHRNKFLEKINPGSIISKAINPKNKSTVLSFLHQSILDAVNKVALKKGMDALEFFNTMSLTEAYELLDNIVDNEVKLKVKKVLDKTMYAVESAGQGAQLKRNVIIPATMRYYTLNSLRGIASTMRLAIMDDILADVFNFIGEDGTIDAHDGAAFINPITSILENWSLLENEVGTVKKPIWHYYDKLHMTSSLVKFAAHTITNNMMQQSQGSRVNMLKMFKKMSNKAWSTVGIEGNILEYSAHRFDGKIDFLTLSGGNDIYYKGTNGQHYKIVNFGYENGVYYTVEIGVNKRGVGSGTVKKYHYFDADSNHFTYTKPLPPESGLHTMSSIYEAHQVFGGINSESLIGEGKDAELQLSEASNYVVANLVNNVTIANPNVKNKEFNQTSYTQPLKTLMVDYLCNNTAIKNGAGNRNSAARYENDEALDTITLGTEYYGIQMDADHEADEAEMTEFSLVISALDAGGRLHAYVRGIYLALGLIALEEAKLEIDAIEAYLKNPNDDTRDALYDIIGRTIINNISTARGLAGLAESIISLIKKRFSLSNSHKLDNLKIPFSDNNIYSNILSTYASIITDKSIRKKYPGLGAVISPGYNIMMVYDIGGRLYLYKDLIKEATAVFKDYKKEKKQGEEHPDDKYFLALLEADNKALAEGYLISSELWDKNVVDAYLLKQTDNYNALKWKYLVKEPIGELPNWDLHTEEFMPTDNVGIQYLIEDGTALWYDIAFDSIDKYYLFKADPRAFLLDILGEPVKILAFRKNIHKARNLAPTKIWWNHRKETKIVQDDGTIKTVLADRTTNIFDSIHLIRNFKKSLLKKLKNETNQVSINKLNDLISRIDNYIARLQDQNVPEYKNTLELLDALDLQSNNKEITLYNTPAELIMSNIYQTRFGIGVEESMIDVIKEGPKKVRIFKLVHQSVTPDFYDFVMTKDNGKNTYISLDRKFISDSPDEDGNLPDVSYKGTYWRDTHFRKNGKDGIIDDVYCTTKDHRILFRIGRTIDRSLNSLAGAAIAYSLEGDYFYYKNSGNKIENSKKLRYVDGKVIETVEFVTRHEVNDKGRKHTVYNINIEELKRTIIPKPIELLNGHVENEQEALYRLTNNYILDLIKEMYEADSYELLTINDKLVKRSNLKRMQKILDGFASNPGLGRVLPFEYNLELTNYLSTISELFNKIPDSREIKRPDLSYDENTDTIKFKESKDNGAFAKIIADRTAAYKKTLNYKKYYSFLRSLYYTASRIPALTLQSFMNMRLVGYTEEGSNLAYVSHWQTWLQGSDYDIDKAFIMGLAFDDNGQYIGWSSLFDFHDLDTIRASEYLPLPRNGVKIVESENGVDISQEVAIINEAEAALKQELDGKSISKYRVNKVLAYAKIFEKLGDNTAVRGSSEDVLKALNHHNETKLPANVKAQALRNFISIHILNTILHVRNAADSYVPVDMEDLRKAAEDSPKGAEAYEITLMNPLSIYTMLYQNMTGKNVIAIAATGQKAAFMWMFYTNEAIKNSKLWDGYVVENEEELAELEKTLNDIGQLNGARVYVKNSDTPVRQYQLGHWIPVEGNKKYEYYLKDGVLTLLPNTDLAYAMFDFTTTRIAGRGDKDANGNPAPNLREVTTHTLSDINLEGVSDPNLINALLEGKLNARIPIDILISLMISAATDNAKELILPRINAGNKLARCYLFLMAMGYDIRDIVKFMTSDVVSWIDILSDNNIFLGQKIRPEEAITEIEKYLKNYNINKNATSYIDENDKVVSNSKKLKLLLSVIPSNLTDLLVSEALKDIEEFRKVWEGSNEFSSFGRLLSINLGLPGKVEDLEKKLRNIRKIITDREKALGIIDREGNLKPNMLEDIENVERYEDIYGGRFDPIRWLLDEEYLARVAEYYNLIKVSLNVFAMASRLPHFNSMFKLLGSECTVNQFSVKSRILSACLLKIAKECPTLYIDDKYYSKILGFASQLTMLQFIQNGEFKFPIRNGSVINSNRTMSNVQRSILSLDTEEGIASFKYYFENVVIPGLKAGTYQDIRNINGKEMTDSDMQIIRYNPFIMALMRGNDGEVPIWKTNINVSADSAYTRILLAKFNKGLNLLQNYKIGKLTIADWFAIYNIIVNKNLYGSDRLTKIFENFVNEFDNKGESIINKYLKYIGDSDYSLANIDKLMNFTAMDLFISQARIVSSTDGLTDPVVIVYEDKVPRYYKRVGYNNYVPMDNILPTVSGEGIEQKLKRFYIQRAYFVLGKPYSSIISKTKELLDLSPLEGLRELIRQGKIEMDIVCV